MADIGSTILDRYSVRTQLGEGGMGTVYLVHDRVTDREVALKMLNSDQQTVERRRARFEREFFILKKLSHPAIVNVYDLHKPETGELFFTMELVAGKPLSLLIGAEATTPVRFEYVEALRLLLQIAKALITVHTSECIYCDLKPANTIIIQEEGKAPGIKLIDFGISRDLAQPPSDADDAGMVGTTFYMSPEQVRGEKIDTRSDIYSFGVLGFELLTGKVPFDSGGVFNVAASHLLAQLPSARKFNKKVSSSLDRMLCICLEKDPKNRYDSMLDVAERLEACIVAAERPGLWERFFGASPAPR